MPNKQAGCAQRVLERVPHPERPRHRPQRPAEDLVCLVPQGQGELLALWQELLGREADGGAHHRLQQGPRPHQAVVDAGCPRR